MGPDFDTWQRGIRRTTCRIFAGFCLVLAAVQCRAALIGPYGLRTTGVTLVAVAVLLVVAHRGWRARLDAKDAWALTLVVTVVAADPYLVGPTGTGGDQSPAFVLLATAYLAHIVGTRGLAVPVAITATTALYVTASVVLGGRMLGSALDDSVIIATAQLAVWLLVHQLTQEAVRADGAHRRTIREQTEAARRTAEHEAMVAAQRTLHDRVLAALVLLTSRGPDPEATRAECRRAAQAVAALGVHPTSRGDVDGDQLRLRLETQADAEAASTGVAVHVTLRAAGTAILVPVRVAEAVCGAVSEALRNVGRHAGVQRAEVVVSVDEAGLLVEVVDHGHGLPAGAAPGFGLRHSVSDRLSEVGGDAQVEALPTGGTRVMLRWQPSGTLPAAPAGGFTAELARIPSHPRSFAGGFALVLLVGALYLAVRYPTSNGPGWADAAVCAGVVAYTAWCVLAVSRPRALRRAHHVGFVVLPGLLALGLHAAGEGGLRGFDTWVVGLCGIPVVLLAMARPALPVIALAALESGVVTAAAVLDPTLAPYDVLSPVTQTPMFVGLVLYGVSAIARVRTAADAHELSLSSALAQRQAVVAREHALGSHYAWLGSEVRPFLEAVADGEVEPGQGAVRQRASTLALAVRDELAVPAQLSASFRRHIASARRLGIRVRVRADDEWQSAAHHRELEALLGLLSTDADLTDITVSLARTSGPPRVVVRPRLSTPQRSAAVDLLGARLLDIDEDDLASIITLHPGLPEYA